MGKYYYHLTWDDRIKIEALLKMKCSQSEIARQLGVNRSTICRELKRGAYIRLDGQTYEEYQAYSPDIAERKYREHLEVKGPSLKIGKDHKLAGRIEELIIEEKYSPEAALAQIEKERKEEQYTVTICKATLYSYIANGLFSELSEENLPIKKKKKKGTGNRKRRSRAAAGDSIEKQPAEVEDRETCGNWEMDTVKGKQGESKKSLLVLTERKTRYEIIILLPDQKAESVVKAMDSLEIKWGDHFKKVFRTITVDNGVEFSDCKGIEKSKLICGQRTKVYYCHPYSSYERGSNENQNRMIRRHIPKGTNFDDISEEEIAKIEGWINDYPRRMFRHQSSAELFEEELRKIA